MTLNEVTLHTQKILLGLMASTLIACGGGGGGGESGGSGSSLGSAGSPAVSDSSTGNTAGSESSEFSIDKDFDLRTVDTIDVVVDLDVRDDELSYLSICHTDDAGDVDYENCVLRSKVVGGYLETEIENPPHVNQLVAAVWFFDQSRPTAFYRFSENDLDGKTISIE